VGGIIGIGAHSNRFGSRRQLVIDDFNELFNLFRIRHGNFNGLSNNAGKRCISDG
jgi:hypothetical protein